MTTILLVEDHAPLADAFEMILEHQGYHVTKASSLKEARSHLASETPDLVIFDYTLPDGHGLELLDGSQKITKSILLSGHSDSTIRRSAMEKGVSTVLVKPVKSALLVNTVLKVAPPVPPRHL